MKIEPHCSFYLENDWKSVKWYGLQVFSVRIDLDHFRHLVRTGLKPNYIVGIGFSLKVLGIGFFTYVGLILRRS